MCALPKNFRIVILHTYFLFGPVLILINSAFHQGLHFLSEHQFNRGFQYTKGIKKVWQTGEGKLPML